jgi:Protein of unknown function (DUF664)
MAPASPLARPNGSTSGRNCVAALWIQDGIIGRRDHDPTTDTAPEGRRAHHAGNMAALSTWQNEITHARANYAAVGLDDTSPFMGERVSLRWIYVHMIAEYARHCGHADLIRERIDGATGV